MLPAAEGVYPKEAEERRFKVMQSYADESTQVDVEYMPAVSGFNPWGGQDRPHTEHAARLDNAHELAADLAFKAQERGYDAFCPYGILDIGVEAARRRGLNIPAVGQAEACSLYCGFLGRKFASCSYVYNPDGEARLQQRVGSWGAGNLYVGGMAIGIPNDQYPQRHDEVRERFVECTRKAKEMGAEMMGLIAMSICPTEHSARDLSEASGFPVLDALATQIAMAQWWHRTGFAPSLLRSPR
jgi:Asp/Glu/hydantoin racemase